MKYNPERIGSVLDQALALAKGQGNFSLRERLQAINNGLSSLGVDNLENSSDYAFLMDAYRRYMKILRSL